MSHLRTPPQLIGHIDSARCVAHSDGRWSIRIKGWLVHGDSEFVVLQAGIPDEPIVMLSTVPRPDLHRTFTFLTADSKPGFEGNIPCSYLRTGQLPVTFLALLPNGTTTAFTMQTVVTTEELSLSNAQVGAEPAPPKPTHLLFMTDSLDAPSDRTEQHLTTLRELTREGFAVTLLETERIGYSERTEALPRRVQCLSTEHSDELDQLLQRHLPSYDVIWVTQPGGLRLLSAMSRHLRGRVVFEPSITLSDDVLASTSEARLEHHSFHPQAPRTLEARVLQGMGTISEPPADSGGWIDIRLAADREIERASHRGHRSPDATPTRDISLGSSFRRASGLRFVCCNDRVGVVYPLQWFVALANWADLMVAPDAQSASQLNAAGVPRVRAKDTSMSSLVKEILASTHTRAQNLPEVGRDRLTPIPVASPVLESPSHDVLVDIIVPIHNAASELRDCLDALIRNTDLPSHLILVDDQSNDPQIAEILSSLPGKLRRTSIKSLTTIRLSRNAGFSGAVNLALSAGAHPYVVLLNTDTLPPPQWLSRLIAPLKADSSIGSVTPLSNAATICSFRPPDESGQRFDPDALLKTDSLFARHGGQEPITIPTGVGFCLASRRSVYEQIGFFDADLFRRMYGEENDWCMRVMEAGLRNVVVTNLFVPHVDGASAKDSDVNRHELLTRNLAKLRTLYPDYDASVEEFLRHDPLEPLRNLMRLVLLREQGHSAPTLYVHNPELAGGSSRYLDQLLAQRNREGESLILAATSDEIFLQRAEHQSREQIRVRDYIGDDARFRELLSTFNIQEIIVNQMVGSEYETLTERIRNCGVPYTVHLHDFFFACPTITLIGHTGRYCGAETRASQCSACLRAYFGKGSDTDTLSITAWREHAYEFLKNASAVVTVSEHTKNIYRSYFPDLAIRVEEPKVESRPPMRTLNDPAISLPILNVAVIGGIGKHKGSDLIYEMVDTLKNRALPIKIVVCGYTDRHSEPYVDPNGFFEVTGRYQPSALPKLLARYRVALTLLPSIWPETFLYTASESMAYGYPVMVSGLTAAAQRVSERDAGWVLEDLSTSGIIRELERLFYNREEIVEKTKNVLCAESAADDPNAPLVVAAQHPFKEFLVEL